MVDRTLKSNYYYFSSICDTGLISQGVFARVCFHSQFILSENGVLFFTLSCDVCDLSLCDP